MNPYNLVIIIDIFLIVSLSLSPREGQGRCPGQWSCCHLIASSEDKWTYVCTYSLAGVNTTRGEIEFTPQYSRN